MFCFSLSHYLKKWIATKWKSTDYVILGNKMIEIRYKFEIIVLVLQYL
jgi:hypothetical protein